MTRLENRSQEPHAEAFRSTGSSPPEGLDFRNAYIRLREGKKPLDAGWGEGDDFERLDANTVREHLAKGHGVAVLTGKRSGHITIDVDVAKGGQATYDALQAEFGFPETHTVRTPSGGFHLCYRYPEGFERVHNDTSGVLFGKGIDLKADYGYRVAPPTAGYEVEDDRPYAEAPGWLIERIEARAEKKAERRPSAVEEVEKVADPADCCEALARQAVAAIERKMDALRALPEGKRLTLGGKQVGWDEGYWLLACRLVEVARWPYASFTLAEAAEVYFAHAPEYDGSFDPEHKWEQGLAAAEWVKGNAHRRAEHFEDDFPVTLLLDAETGEPIRSERVTEAPSPTDAVRGQFPILDIGVLDPDRPPRRWFWEGIVPEGDHVSVVAPGGTGKSLLTLALAIAAVSGDEAFVGRPLAFPEGRKVLYIDMENSEDDWAERLRSLGVTLEKAKGFWGSSFVPLSFPAIAGLDTAAGASQLQEILDAYGFTSGDVVVLDSTQRVTEGEENSNDTIRSLYSLTSAELKRRGLTVIRTDNTGKDASLGARGASAKNDDVAYSWLLERRGQSDIFTLTNTKFRGLGSGAALRFRRAVEDGLLVFEPIIDAEVSTLVRSNHERFQIAATTVLHDQWNLAKAAKDIEPSLTQTGLVNEVKKTSIDGKPVPVDKNHVKGLLTDLVEGGYLTVEGGRSGSLRYTWRRDYLGVAREPRAHTPSDHHHEED